MLHWLAGQKQLEGPSDPDATGYIEAPETPAPVFAVRAFKQAIFGTPQTVQPKPRRHSNNDSARPRPQRSKPDRPHLTRPKSAGDARGLSEDVGAPIPEPVASPTKGILMTPGTAATKRKTVTFGEHVTDNQEKRPMKTGLPDDCPGKFPSPWTKPSASVDAAEPQTEKGKGRSKLTEALEQVRDESAKRGAKPHKRSTSRDDDDIAETSEEPLSESALYWKTQYDVYRDNSQREIKKLITKQKAAKSFAKDKDFQCTELADEFQQERKKVDKLEKRTAELEAQIKAMREQLEKRQEPEQKATDVSAKLEAASNADDKAKSLTGTRVIPHEPAAQSVVAVTDPAVNPLTAKPSLEGKQPVSTNEDKPKVANDPVKSRARARPANLRTKTSDDIWNQFLNTSSPAVSRPVKSPVSPKAGRTVTSGTSATPLMSLSVNTLPTAPLTRRDSAQPSPPMDRFTKEPLVRQEVARSPRPDEKRRDSPVLSPGLPQPSPEPVTEAQAEVRSPTSRRGALVETADEVSMPLPASGPFRPSPVLSPPGAATKKSYFDRTAQPPVKSLEGPATRGNTSPAAKPKSLPSENVKPMAAWNAINAPNVGKRVTSLTDKTGKEVGFDRIEAAKARMAARGRILS